MFRGIFGVGLGEGDSSGLTLGTQTMEPTLGSQISALVPGAIFQQPSRRQCQRMRSNISSTNLKMGGIQQFTTEPYSWHCRRATCTLHLELGFELGQGKQEWGDKNMVL